MDNEVRFSFHSRPFKTPEERLAASRLSITERQGLVQNLLAPYPAFDET